MIAIGSDHAGYDLKVQVMAHLDEISLLRIKIPH